MPYAILRFQKRKAGGVAACERHNERKKEAYKSNPDIDMERSKYMGDDLYTGIVNGAIWIAENYYNKGQNTTASMNSVPYHSYAPGNEKWVPNIVDFMNTFYKNWRNNGNER